MRATFSTNPKYTIVDARPGHDLFVVHSRLLDDCICAIAYREFEAMPSSPCDVVVVACRVRRGEVGYRCTGSIHPFPRNTPITLLEQIEPSAFRERGAADVVPYRKRETGVFETFVQTAGGLEAAPPLRE